MQHLQTAGVLRGGADGDADVVREAVAVHVAEDDALLEAVIEHLAPLPGLYQDEVAVAGDVGDAPGVERGVVLLLALVHHAYGGGEVLGVIQGGDGGNLCHEVHIEGGAGFVQQVRNGGGGDGVTGAEAGKAVSLGEGAEDGDVLALVHVLEGVRLLLREVDVGLIKHDDDVLRHLGHEGIKLLLEHHGAEGVGGVGDEDEAGLRGDGAEHGSEVVAPIRLVVYLHIAGAEELAHDGVHGEAVLGRDELDALVQAGVAQQLDELTAAAADGGLLEGDAVHGGELAAQGEGGAIRVNMHAGGGLLHGLYGLGRGAEGVLIGCQFDDGGGLQPQLSSGFFDGFTGLISH